VRILIHGINFAPELTGIGKYSGEMAEWLAARGHDVRVVTAPPYYPDWRVGSGYAGWQYRRERLAGVDVWRCPVWVPRKPSGLKRILHLASFALSSAPIMLRQIFWRPQVVLVIEPPLMCAPAAWLTARLSGARAWLHIQDFEVDAAFELGILRAAWLKGWVLMIERLLMRRFDRVSTISVKMLEKLNSKGVAADKSFFFANWVDPDEIHPLDDSANGFRTRLGILPSQLVALYSGNMGEKQGLEIILEVAAMLQADAAIRFVLCGEGAARLRLQQQYAALSNVIWLPLQPLNLLNELLNMADVHLLPQRSDVADLVMPSKLLGMLASGRPVISNALAATQVGGIVAQCGILSRTDSARAFADALILLAASPDKRKRLGIAGRQIAAEKFSREVVLREFELELERVSHA
jgi:colanic acid biosynthesis glycosyl transferase WcaI